MYWIYEYVNECFYFILILFYHFHTYLCISNWLTLKDIYFWWRKFASQIVVCVTKVWSVLLLPPKVQTLDGITILRHRYLVHLIDTCNILHMMVNDNLACLWWWLHLLRAINFATKIGTFPCKLGAIKWIHLFLNIPGTKNKDISSSHIYTIFNEVWILN